MIRRGIDAAREAARRLLADLNIDGIPVPVERLARLKGVKVQYAPLDMELSGMAYIRDGQGIIGVNSLHHPNRQRFTIAHELAHHVLHSATLLGSAVHVDKVILKRDVLAAQGSDTTEIEANNFAAELLMPEAWINKTAGAGFDVSDDEALATLARKFKVSPSALQYRLVNM